ncbi:conserved hypothetical protein [Verticillium alfalfae VaMs.102]|uniref:U6 snRNA phosphodiesterase 1 n=1 Tax=Verticillium alfalfae (strain VaMs.102 / ATCC MYA-4576 / FGSC 10136) TaxID=526221 RepID=C9SR10_VERA1|nr:conserved hypothetical protein [Verticillium alfalfae VaMs.102]EEY21285.1 conserved hypothetical protein [Verticillium alfalfae VaMs.102]
MALVDYSSDSSVVTADSEIAPPPAKKQRSGGGPDGKVGEASHPTASDLPPLPESFHDLYASSVRQRHPTIEQHALLVEFLDAAQKQLGTTHRLHSFLTSDLNAPLPLHISLSKSLSLTTANKDGFLDALTSSLRTTSAAVKGPFAVSPSGLAFYKSPDSDRAFLVLRVADPKAKPPIPGTSANPQLRELLRRCNIVASSRGLPTLYASRDQVEAASEGKADAETDALVDHAFHVSIAWTFALPDEEMCIRTYRIFRAPSFKKLRNWEVRVSGVKVKIGNVVTHLLLGNGKVAGGGRGSRESSRSARSPTGDDSPY